MVHADIRGVSSWRGRQMRAGRSATPIFGDLSGYFFGIFRDKASNIIWRYATPYRPVIDCKMNDLEWPWVAILCQHPFLTQRACSKIMAWNVRFVLRAREKYTNDSSFWQYEQFVDFRRRFLYEWRQSGVWSLKSTNLPFSCCYVFASFRNNVLINCTLRRHTVLDFYQHQ